MTDEAIKAEEQRAAVRVALTVPGRVTEPFYGGHTVELLDMSATGARLSTYRNFQVGQTLYLTVQGIQAIKCTVRWVKPGEIGVAFERELYAAILDHIAATNRRR